MVAQAEMRLLEQAGVLAVCLAVPIRVFQAQLEQLVVEEAVAV
jgi:hypothetical protein